MAIRTQSVVLAWGRDYDFGPWGLSTFADVESRLVPPHTSKCDFARGIMLRPRKLTGTYRSIVRSVGGIQSWGPSEVAVVGTGIQIRATDGHDDYWFTAGAWTKATTSAHWNVPNDLYAALPIYRGTALGFVVRLSRTSTTDDSPIFMGVKAIARIEFRQTGADPLRASSWEDDLIHRILITELRKIRLSGVQEMTAVATTSLSFAAGADEFPHDVIDIEAVINRTTGAEIPGSFNASTLVWTPTSPITDGTQLHVRYGYRPFVVHTGDIDRIAVRLPEIAIESIQETDRQRPNGVVAVRDFTSRAARAVACPTQHQFLIGLRLIGGRATERGALKAGIERLFNTPMTRISPTTSLPVELLMVGQPSTGNIIGDGFDLRITLAADCECWHGEEETVAHTGAAGCTLSGITEE